MKMFYLNELEILNQYFDEETIDFIKSYRFDNGPIAEKVIDNLFKYCFKVQEDDFSLGRGKFDNLNDSVHQAVCALLHITKYELQPMGAYKFKIPDEMKTKAPERYAEVVNKLNQALENIWDALVIFADEQSNSI